MASSRQGLKKVIARLRRSLLAPQSPDRVPAESEQQTWTAVTARTEFARTQIPEDAQAVEISSEVRSARRPASQALIGRLRFLDKAGNILAARSPGLLESEPGSYHFLPLEHAHAGVFRFVCLVPRGAVQVEYALHLRRSSERFGFTLRGLTLRPIRSSIVLDTVRADASADPAWRAERELRSAIAQRADSLLNTTSPLRAQDSPFCEAVVEYLILDSHDVARADRLAERRLGAGRDREALTLSGVSQHPGLPLAAARRDLLALAAHVARPTPGRKIGPGRLLLVAEKTGSRGGDAAINAMNGAGWSIEACGPGAASKTDLPADADPASVRALADRIVAKGRGRDVGLVWARCLGDAVAAADAATRLGVPFVYEADDIATAVEVVRDTAQGETDAGRLNDSLNRTVLMAADILLAHTQAAAAWLAGQGVQGDRILLASDDVALTLEALLEEPETSGARRRRARTPT